MSQFHQIRTVAAGLAALISILPNLVLPSLAQHENCPVIINRRSSGDRDLCPDLGKNMDLVKESQQYLNDHPKYTERERTLEYRSPSHFETYPNHLARRSDSSPPQPRDVNYLTVPIETPEDIKNARDEAAELTARGPAGAMLGSKIQKRIANIMEDMFQQQLTDTKLKCISVAEELRRNSWKCQERGLHEKATQLNERVLGIYQKEVGNIPKTAGVMADLGKLEQLQDHPDKAQDWYARALQIYNSYPNDNTAERASFLENFADFLSQRRQTKYSNNLFQQAREVRQAMLKASTGKASLHSHL